VARLVAQADRAISLLASVSPKHRHALAVLVPFGKPRA
jgi:hypothetical protein